MVKTYFIDPRIEKCLPPLDENCRLDLKASIARGYDKDYPLIIWEGHDIIVDGQHRYALCIELGIEPTISERAFASIEDAILYAIDHQKSRRNLNHGQLAIIGMARFEAEEVVKARERQRESGNQYAPSLTATQREPKSESATVVAKKSGVTTRDIYSIRAVRKKGVTELESMIMREGLSPGMADAFVHAIPLDKQAEIVKGGINAVTETARKIERARKEKLRLAPEMEEQRKFEAFNKTVAEKTAIAHDKIARIFQAAHGGCLMPNVSELFCEDCNWGFDIYIPLPATTWPTTCCPYCRGTKVSKRDADWNSREVV